MNVKIGELVEYVEDLKLAHRRRVETLRKANQILVDIKRENEEELDGRDQLIHQLEERVKIAEENATSCLKSFKEMEAQIDKSIRQEVIQVKLKIAKTLRETYGYSDEGLKNIGVL